jgi:cob(I)alamin adenosyltransferase
MKIYTKTGDKGETSLIGGKRLSKAHPRIDTYGLVDELNVYIGLVRDQTTASSRKEFLINIQNKLFTVGSLLASDPDKKMASKIPQLKETDIEVLELAIDAMDSELPAMRFFVLPGGHTAVSFCHLARVICRKAERACISLRENEPIPDLIVQYLNRLSDYLFVLSRLMTQELGAEEIPWISKA